MDNDLGISNRMTANRNLKVFLCHSKGDKAQVRELYHHLVTDGFDAWLDEEKLIPGQDWDYEIRKAVRDSDVFIVCVSNGSVTKTGYIQKEIRFALDVADEQPEGAVYIIPARLEDCQIPDRLRKWHWVNLYNENGYERLKVSLQLQADALGISSPLAVVAETIMKPAPAKEPEDHSITASEMASALKTELTSPSETQAQGTTASRTVTTRPRQFPRWLFWGVGMFTLLIAGLSFARFEFPHKTTRAATGVIDPTVHIAQAVKSPTGETQWTFGCLGTSIEALVDLNCRQIRIAIQNRQLPYNYILLGTNQPGGMDYDMWWDICSRLHCQPVFIEEKWETTLSEIASGAYDAAAEGITITDQRKQVVAFSNSYMNVDQRLVVRKGETRFANIYEFVANDQLMAGVLENSTNFDIAKQFIPENRIRTYKEYSTIFYALTTGDIDAAFANQAEGQTTIIGIDFQQAVNLEFIGNSLSSDQFGIVFPKNSDLVEPVNKALQDMRAQGTLEELITRYFGPSFGVTYQDIGLGAYGQ